LEFLGTVSLYEYLLTLALVNNDPKLILKCLFKLFDTNEDGRLNQAEIVDILNVYSQVSSGDSDNTNQETLDSNLAEIKSSVAKAFGNKTQISEDEFREVCEKSSEIQGLASRLQMVFLFGMMVDESDFQA
jgi:Ca2+-binding EF-hand superfamily protein